MHDAQNPNPPEFPFHEEVELTGHIIDSLILPKVLDQIIGMGGSFDLRDVHIGQRQNDPSHTRVLVSAPTAEILEEILTEIAHHGAVSTDPQDCQFEAAEIPGTFPERFYATTNQDTNPHRGEWIPVTLQEMDCGIKVDPENKTAQCIPMSDVQKDDLSWSAGKARGSSPRSGTPAATRGMRLASCTARFPARSPKA